MGGTLVAPASRHVHGPVQHEPFGRVPTTYVLCERDHVVHPEHQATLAARCDRVVRIERDHFPMFEPDRALVTTIADAANVHRH